MTGNCNNVMLAAFVLMWGLWSLANSVICFHIIICTGAKHTTLPSGSWPPLNRAGTMVQSLAKMMNLNQLARAFVGVAFVAGVWRFAEPILQALLVLNVLTFMRCDMTPEQVCINSFF
jgi:hypothetical protein